MNVQFDTEVHLPLNFIVCVCVCVYGCHSAVKKKPCEYSKTLDYVPFISCSEITSLKGLPLTLSEKKLIHIRRVHGFCNNPDATSKF